MATEVNLINTLVNKADGILANTDNIYDKDIKEMQNILNRILNDYFNFKISSNNLRAGTIKGSALDSKTIGYDKLSDDAINRLRNDQSGDVADLYDAVGTLQDAFISLQNKVQSISDWVDAFVINNNIVGRCGKKGFFIIDEDGYVGACIIPESSTIAYYGWGETPSETVSYTDGNGIYIRIPDVSFENSGLGSITAITDYSIVGCYFDGVPTISGTNRIVLVVKPDSNHSTYQGGYNWSVDDGSTSYLQFIPGSENKFQGTGDNLGVWYESAQFNILPAATNNTTVSVTCRAKENYAASATKSFTVSYTSQTVPVTSNSFEITSPANIDLATNSPTNPIEGTTFTIKINYLPNNANVQEYHWYLGGEWSNSSALSPSGQETYLESHGLELVSNVYNRSCTFRIKNVSAIPYASIGCRITHTDDTYYNSTWQTVYYQYGASNSLIDITINAGNGGVITAKDTECAIDVSPVGADAGTVTWDGEGVTFNTPGIATLNDDVKVGDTVTIYATSENLSDNRASITLTNQYANPVEKMTIFPLNGDYETDKIQLRAYFTPDMIDANPAWRITTGSRYASIDAITGLITVNSIATDFSFIRVAAAYRDSSGNTFVKEAEYRVKYLVHSSVREYQIIHPLYNIGGAYIDCYANIKTINTRDDEDLSKDAFCKWEIVSAVTSEDISNVVAGNYVTPGGGGSHVQQSPSVPCASGTDEATISVPINSGTSAQTVPLADLKLYTLDVANTSIGEASDSTVFNDYAISWTQSITRSATYPRFGNGTDGPKNRLFLNPNVIGAQGVLIKCTYYDGDPESVSSNVINSNSFYKEFIYQKKEGTDVALLPVEGITLQNVNTSDFTITNSSTVPTITITAAARWYQNKTYKLLPYVIPTGLGTTHPETGNPTVLSDYLFDTRLIRFTHENGLADSSLCHLASWNGGIKVNEGVNNHENLIITYALYGETVAGTQDHNKRVYENQNYFYCAKNRMQVGGFISSGNSNPSMPVAYLSRPAVQYNISSVSELELVMDDTYISDEYARRVFTDAYLKKKGTNERIVYYGTDTEAIPKCSIVPRDANTPIPYNSEGWMICDCSERGDMIFLRGSGEVTLEYALSDTLKVRKNITVVLNDPNYPNV